MCKSASIFRAGVDPIFIITALDDKQLLTRQEWNEATQETLTDGAVSCERCHHRAAGATAGARCACVPEEADRARIVLRVETEGMKMWTPYRAEQQQSIQDQNSLL